MYTKLSKMMLSYSVQRVSSFCSHSALTSTSLLVLSQEQVGRHYTKALTLTRAVFLAPYAIFMAPRADESR